MRLVEAAAPEPADDGEPVELMQAPDEISPEVADRLRYLRINHEAQRLLKAELAAQEIPEVVGVDEVLDLVPADPLLGELLYRNTLAQVAGPPGTFKSFIAIGMACAIATGRDWGQHQVHQTGHVLYIAAEGGAGIGVRLAAWCKHYGVDPSEIRSRFHVMTKPIQLGADSHVAQLRTTIEQIRPELVVVDTRARSTVGLEENSATDQGVAIAALDGIREDTGACFLVVHHTGANGTQRGSTAWKGGVWSEIDLRPSGLNRDSNGKPLGATLEVVKHKDAEEPPPQSFDMEAVRVPQAWMPNVRRAAQLTTLVAVPAEQVHTSVETQGSREERKSEEGEKLREWLLAQHAQTGRVPGRPTAKDWAKSQGLSLGSDALAALVREAKAEVES